jgi:IS30 family transposase
VADRLTLEEREEIATGLAAGGSMRSIARRLGRAASTISREVAANSFHRHGLLFDRPEMAYRASSAQRAALGRRPRPRPGRLVCNRPLRELVLRGLRRRWSPKQIAERLKVQYPNQPEMRVSHETIYQAIYVQARGNLRAELKHQVALRSGRIQRRSVPVAGAAIRSRRDWVGLNIAERPPSALLRLAPVDWEGDLVVGKNGKSAIATLVDRASRYVLLVALDDSRVSEHVVARLISAVRRLPAGLMQTLTWDQGSEMARHATFTLATDCAVYFCDPHAPWQRPTNENTNGLVRQYYPKGVTDFRKVTQAQLDEVAHELNGRPRRVLGWQTPAEELNRLLTAGVATTA